MSRPFAYDTHRFVKNLTASGFTEAQAEALAGEQVRLLESNLVTKSDLAAVKSDLATVKSDLELKVEQVKSDLELKVEQVKSDLEVKIEKTRADILKWMIGATTAHAALIAGLVWNLYTRLPGGN